MSDLAEVLAVHQKTSMGMTSGSPDKCKCGERLFPTPADDEITIRRDRAFAAHQSDMIAAVLGPVMPARAGALQEAAAVGWDAAVAAMTYEDGAPVEVAANVNPYRVANG